MGKIFKFFRDPAARVSKPGDVTPAGEAAAMPEERLRQLMRREYSPEQVGLLKELTGLEGATRYAAHQVAIDDVVAPPVGDMLKILSDQTGMRMVDLNKIPRANYKLQSKMPAELAKQLLAVPVEELPNGTLVIAIGDPTNPTLVDDLRLHLDRDIEVVIANESDIKERVEAYYGMSGQSLDQILDEEDAEEEPDDNPIAATTAGIDLSDAEAMADASPVIRLVNYMLLKAINERASDIHIEPFPAFIRIRYRVDGVLREIPSPPRNQLTAIVSRIKVISGMNISETRLPQDGRLKLAIEGREIDMRVSSCPTVHGESIVMRVLDKGMMMIGISQIGMMGEVLERYKKLIRKPNGIVLVTGPTGCGKTTTLYAALAEVKDPGEKLITTEDPVEYELEGIQQVSINEGVGLTFARCLRAILRQDPDTVLVGEIRDVETAQIAVQASLTGHLVFSTLHTNSAAATVTRLLDMGVEPFLITSSLEGVIGQRLVRTICQRCKKPYMPTEEELLDFGITMEEFKEEGITLYQGEGCPECQHSGYHGRLGIFELLEVDDDIREMILERATTDELQEAALRKGMVTMRRDGWYKCCMGLTTLGEISRQTPKEHEMLTSKSEPAAIEAPPETPALPEPTPQLNTQTMGIDSEAAQRRPEDGSAGVGARL